MTDSLESETTSFEVVTNVFEALEIPNPDWEMARCELVGMILRISKERNLDNRKLARLAGCSIKRIRQLRAVEYDDVTIDELCRYLVALGHNVQIQVSPLPRTNAQLTVVIP